MRLGIAQKRIFHPFYYVGVFGHFFSAVFVTGITERWSGLWQCFRKTFNLRINIGWYLLVGLLRPIGVALCQFSLYLLLGGKPEFPKAYLLLNFGLWTATLTMVVASVSAQGSPVVQCGLHIEDSRRQ